MARHGLQGADQILLRPGGLATGDDGNDVITILAAGVVYGGNGHDRIEASNGAHDVVFCGPGADTVRADAADEVDSDCEQVSRT